jgi:sugar lactone lactonase YvrE
LNGPLDLVVDAENNLYISDSNHHRIRRVASDNGTIFDCTDGNHTRNTITTAAGNGQRWVIGEGNPATSAPLGAPYGITVDPAGNIFIGDVRAGWKRVRRVDGITHVMTTIAGTGSASSMDIPHSLVVDSHGNVYFADSGDHLVRKIDASGGIWTVAGVRGETGFDTGMEPMLATSARLNKPTFLAIDVENNLYVSDTNNLRIRRIDAFAGEIDPANSTITTVAGGGTSTAYDTPTLVDEIMLSAPSGLAITEDFTLYATNGDLLTPGANGIFELPSANQVDVYTADTHFITKIAGTTEADPDRCFVPLPYCFGATFPVPMPCGDGGAALSACLNAPEGLAYHMATGDLYVVDGDTWRVRRLWSDSTEWRIEAFAGDTNKYVNAGGLYGFGARFTGDGGLAADATLQVPMGVAVDADGNVFIADALNAAVRRVDAGSGIITTAAGAVFPVGDTFDLGRSALGTPYALARLDSSQWLVADGVSKRVRLVDPTPGTGSVSSVAGYPGVDEGVVPPYLPVPARYLSRRLENPTGIAFDPTAGYAYVAETDMHVIRLLDTTAPTWTIQTWAGVEPSDPAGPSALTYPTGLALDPVNRVLYFAEPTRNVVRSVSLDDPTQISTVAGTEDDPGVPCSAAPGDAVGTESTRLLEPTALALDPNNTNLLYVVDTGCHMVRRIDLADAPAQSTRVIGTGTALAPSNGSQARDATLDRPRGAAVDSFGNLHVASRSTVVTVTSGDNGFADELDSTILIYGTLPQSDLEQFTDCLSGIAVADPSDSAQDELFVLDRCAGYMIRLNRTQ